MPDYTCSKTKASGDGAIPTRVLFICFVGNGAVDSVFSTAEHTWGDRSNRV